MFNDHSKQDVVSMDKPSPWPLVAGFIAFSAICSVLLIAFGS
ncbi:hypothetical protein [Roseibium algae]|uniref:Cytochrome c oxidase subunit 3 n=1 Tax=Roseibium algae TaxID=3123038 RepID=A0ABU8TEP1_9HYPH